MAGGTANYWQLSSANEGCNYTARAGVDDGCLSQPITDVVVPD